MTGLKNEETALMINGSIIEIENIQKSMLDDTLRENTCIKRALDESSIVAITDKHGVMTYVNKKFCDISKYTANELIGKNHRILKSGFHSPEFYRSMWKTISSGNIWRGVIKNKAKDGTFYWVKTTIVPFLDTDGTPKEYVSIRNDITEQISLQEEKLNLERFAAIGELSSRIAHDIRNPLSVISTSVELIRKKQLKGELVNEKTLERIEKSIFRISHQLNDVLNFVRKSPLKVELTTSSELIMNVLDKIPIPKPIIINKPQINIEMNCDCVKIEALISNLVINAIQSVGESGTISIRVHDNQDSINIEVEDSGPGVPDEIKDRIFDPLFTTKQTGTGLGLASCKSIVESHGGTISYRNCPTTFIARFPKNIPVHNKTF